MLRLVFALALALASLALAGCSKKPADQQNGGLEPNRPGLPAPDPRATELPVVTTADAWHAEFKTNAAGAKYKGRVIEISGTVDILGMDFDGRAVGLTLKVKNEFLGVQCKSDDALIWEKLSPDSEVTLRGRWDHNFPHLGNLVQVTVVSVKSNPALARTPGELVKQAKDKPFDLAEELRGKWFYIEGKFASRGKEPSGEETLTLEGADGASVKAFLVNEVQLAAMELKQGQQVKALAQLKDAFGGGGAAIKIYMVKAK